MSCTSVRDIIPNQQQDYITPAPVLARCYFYTYFYILYKERDIMKNNHPEKIIRCGLYDRVSTELQARHGLSVDTQKELLTDYAVSHGYEIVDYYIDEGLTARKKLQNRKEFVRLLNDVQAGKIDLILVTKLDRWFRNVKDYHNTQAILEANHCNWKTILEDYDTSTADGQLKINIMLAVAQNESDRTSERIKVVFEHKKRNQEHLNGPIPFGYKVVDKRLQKDEDARTITEDIFHQYLSCFSKRKTIAYTQNTYGDRAPTAYQINRMLTSEVYAGMRYGKTGYCEPYITQEQLRMILSVCDSKTYPATKEPYLFSQLMKCPHCGAGMTGFVHKHKCKDGTVTYSKRYRCSRKYDMHSGGPCITEKRIENYMLKNLYPELQNRIYQIQQCQKQAPKKDNTWKITSEMERLNLLFQKGRIGIDYYDEQYEKLEQELRDEHAAHKIVTVESYQAIQEKIAGNWKELYEKLDYEHKRSFWRSILAEIYIDPETHQISGFDFLIDRCSN